MEASMMKVRKRLILFTATTSVLVLVLTFLYLHLSEHRPGKGLVRARPRLSPNWVPSVKVKSVVEVSRDLPTLEPAVIDGVKKFVLFVGYPHSGHSIVGTILDAHPHIVMAHEFMLFERSPIFSEPQSPNWTQNLFNVLYQDSHLDASNGTRLKTNKGYSLSIDGLWQGRFDKHIDVIGDKSGGTVTNVFMFNKADFFFKYSALMSRLPVSIKVIHVMRNPFDMIATSAIFSKIHKDRDILRNQEKRNVNTKFLTKKKFARAKESIEKNTDIEGKKLVTDEFLMNKHTNITLDRISAVMEIIDYVREENVLTVHNSDLIQDPQTTIRRVCEFLEVGVNEDYLQRSSAKVFKSTSRTRDLVKWSPYLVSRVIKEMKQFALLDRYNFTSD